MTRDVEPDANLMGRTTKKRKAPARRSLQRKRPQRGEGLDIQKWLGKTGIEFHWPGYQYMGPGTHLKKRLTGGDPRIEYARAKNLRDKWKADDKMIAAISRLPGQENLDGSYC